VDGNDSGNDVDGNDSGNDSGGDDDMVDNNDVSNDDNQPNDEADENSYVDDEEDVYDDYVTDYETHMGTTRTNLVDTYHQDAKVHNHKEVIALSKTTRNKNGTIIDPLHTTTPILTKYERTRILGMRTKQINSGAEPFVEITDDSIIDGGVIASMELDQKRIPFIIRRPMPGGGSEYWRVIDLEIV